MISIAIGLILAFTVGVFVLRQTHAIWNMNTSNAMTVNASMNTIFSMNPFVEIVVMVLVICGVAWCMSFATGRGF